jgi:hypothetical protein
VKNRSTLAGLSVVLALVASVTLGMPSPQAQAATTPTIQIVAGTGTAGFSGDTGPATAAQISGPAGISTDGAGNVYFMDGGNRRIRQIDTAGAIHTVVGDGTACGAITDVTLPVSGLCPDSGYGYGGLAATPDGLKLYYRDNVGISVAAPGGNAYRYAGKYTGLATYGDGPKFDVTVDPHDVALDPSTGNVDFIDNHAVRAATPAGQVVTLAGTTADCDAPSDDTTPAVGACLWPRHLAVHGGRVFFTEQSSWNGPRARYIDGNTLHTIAGNGTRSEPTTGGPATSSGFPDMGGIAVDSQGNVYLSGLSRGRIWQVAAADQALSLVTEFQGGAGWMTTDTTDNLYVSLPYLQQVAKISGLVAQAPVPTVVSVSPADPQPSDPMLTRGVYFLPLVNGAAIDRFEYGWSADPAAASPSTKLQVSHSLVGRLNSLNYSEIRPDSDWFLIARAISPDGAIGPWSPATKVHTPGIPRLIFGIDSVTSGHHNDYGDNNITTCDDPNYGYASDFALRWLAVPPAWWTGPGQVVNVAHSGFATEPRAGSGIKGTALTGGKNACPSDKPIAEAPIVTAENALKLSPNSWNRWIATGGIDDTNWDVVIRDLVGANLIAENLKGRTLSPKECGNLIAANWDETKSVVVQASITNGVRQIASRLQAADPDVQITWLSYYNAAGTGTNKVRINPFLPATCEYALGVAVGKLNGAISAGLPKGASLVDVDQIMHMRSDYVQPLFFFTQLFDGAKNPSGWPHPNRVGALAISNSLML